MRVVIEEGVPGGNIEVDDSVVGILMDEKVLIRHDNLTQEQVVTHLPEIVFKRLKGRVLNAVETYLDPNDPRFSALRNEICLHISDVCNDMRHQLYENLARKIGMDVDLGDGGKNA